MVAARPVVVEVERQDKPLAAAAMIEAVGVDAEVAMETMVDLEVVVVVAEAAFEVVVEGPLRKDHCYSGGELSHVPSLLNV